MGKAGKKKGKGNKKIVDAYARKEWYDVRAPTLFQVRNVGKTMVNKTQGNKLARDSLLGRVFSVSLGDLKQDAEEESYRQFKLKVQDVQGRICLTSFHGMSISTDKQKSLVRKWQTTIDAFVDIKTTDGFTLRLFCVGFTSRRANQNKKTSYAQSAQVRMIRKKMIEIMQREGSCTTNELVKKFMTASIGKEIQKDCQGIYPLRDVYVTKCKVLRSPKTDVAKLMEAHGGAEDISKYGKELERIEAATKAAGQE